MNVKDICILSFTFEVLPFYPWILFYITTVPSERKPTSWNGPPPPGQSIYSVSLDVKQDYIHLINQYIINNLVQIYIKARDPSSI